jgi:hypothetical protein
MSDEPQTVRAGLKEYRSVSQALATEVTRKVRERGIVVWIDAERQFSGLVDALAEGGFDFSYKVARFRGSYLELMLALEDLKDDVYPDKVLVHLAGLNKETVKETPALELYKAGSVFEKSLGSVVRDAAVGVVAPDEVDAFLNQDGVTLEGADAWLAGERDQPRDRMTLLLEARGVDEVVLGLIGEEARLAAHLPEEGEKLLAFLERGLGLTPAWRRYRLGEQPLNGSNAARLVASFLMAVEFVHDLTEVPVVPELVALRKLGSHTKRCLDLVARARAAHPLAYELLANELQDAIEQERTSHHAAALGSIDTFRFEEAIIRADTLSKLAAGEWEVATVFAAKRTPEECFWVRRSEPLQRTWELMRLAAKAGLGMVSTRQALDRCTSLEEAVERYVTKLARVDRDHRLFEQRARTAIVSELEDYDRLLAVRDAVRATYRAWADATNRVFFALCQKHGPLPPRELRQRAIYTDRVQPLAEQGRVAYFMVDALRFEMAAALAAELEREKFRVTLRARLAELPTVTAVGMNALAPVEQGGRLRAVQASDGAILGFSAGSFRVTTPDKRVEAVRQRTGDVADLELDEVVAMPLDKLKAALRSKPRVVVVRSRELDDAGEVGLHLATFDHLLALLKSAVSLLSQAGIERFLIASDHGFLLQDSSTENVEFGASMRVPERRHALLEQTSGMPDVLEVKLSALEYEVEHDVYLVLRPDTALWKTRSRIEPFAHGGNSLQERVIPVLELERAAARGKTLTKYEVVARAEPAHLGRQRLVVSVRLQTRQTDTLDFFKPKSISLALRVPDHPEIVISLLDANPPGKLEGGRLHVPPNQGETRLEFELEGQLDAKVRVEIFHPEGKEDVSPKLVEGFFDVAKVRRPRGGAGSIPPPASGREPAPAPATPTKASPDWAELVEDEGFRRVFQIIEQSRIINEIELQTVLGSSRRVRSFALHYDELVAFLPFEVEVTTVNGMKAYKRRD